MASGKRDSNPRPSAWEIKQWCVRVYKSVVCDSGCFYGKQFTNLLQDTNHTYTLVKLIYFLHWDGEIRIMFFVV